MREYFIWLAKVITTFFALLFIIPAIIAAIAGVSGMAGKLGTPGENPRKTVAVVELEGAIENSKEVLDQLYKNASDHEVKGIVLRIDSPGGAVGPSQEIYSAVKKLKEKKPIIASMGGVAASGGFYAALGASKVYASPGTLTGSIGVIMQVPNFQQISEKIGFSMITIKSGKLKDVGNQFREMTPEEREFLEDTVRKVQDDFIQAVVDGRNLPREKVLPIADGRVIVGSDAKKYGLIDEYGDVHDAARAVFDILKEPLGADEQPRLLYSTDKFGELRQILKGVVNLTTQINPMTSHGELQYLMQ